MDAKRLAMILGIAILLPLFIGLFVDAVYSEPKYENYCNETQYLSYPQKVATNCTYNPSPKDDACYRDSGIVRYTYDSNGCQVYDTCDYCGKNYNKASQVYNRNIFFILAPLGLLMVVLGMYFLIDYMGAGLMFGGLITLLYSTIRYFSDMSKIWRALVILIELLIIMWIGYKKIGSDDKKSTKKESSMKKKKR